MDIAQICMNLIHGHDKKLKKSFGDPDLIFKVTLENQIAKFRPKYLNAHYLQSGSVDFTQICMNSIFGHENKPIKFLETLTSFSRSH